MEEEEDEFDDTNPERFPPPLVLPVRKKESKSDATMDSVRMLFLDSRLIRHFGIGRTIIIIIKK